MVGNNECEASVLRNDTSKCGTDAHRSWEVVLEDHRKRITALKRKREGLISDRSALTSTEDYASGQVVHTMLSALAPYPRKTVATTEDFALIRRTGVWIVEAIEEGVLTESEAQALLRFIAARFAERRLDLIMEKFFNVGGEEQRTFRALKGTVK